MSTQLQMTFGVIMDFDRDYNDLEKRIICNLTCEMLERARVAICGLSKERHLARISPEDVVLTMRARVRAQVG